MVNTFPDNPFGPVHGELPPFMGRRPDVEAAFDNLERLLDMSVSLRSRSHLIYGPRGTGKTVHIRSLRADSGLIGTDHSA